jgi:hypothetical protein
MGWTKTEERDLGYVREVFDDVTAEVVELASMAPTAEAVRRIAAVQRGLRMLRAVLFVSTWNVGAARVREEAQRNVQKDLGHELHMLASRLAVRVLGITDADVLATEMTSEPSGRRVLRARLRDGRTLGVRFDRFWTAEVLGEVACLFCDEVGCARGVG